MLWLDEYEGVLGLTGYGVLWLDANGGVWLAEWGMIGMMLSTEIGRGGFGLIMHLVM